jgi:hypothetical protein
MRLVAAVTILYPDVSNNQWGLPYSWSGYDKLIAFLRQLRPDFGGVVHKVSEGADFIDPYWRSCRAWCESNGLSWLGYHYVTTDDSDAQVSQWVANNGGPYAMLDFEARSGNGSNFWSVVNAFNKAGVSVTLAYYPRWYWGGIGQPDLGYLATNQISLVSSNYPNGPDYVASGGDGGPGWLPYGDATPSVWQFTDEATIAGVTCDCNAYHGTNLDALFTGNVFLGEQ